MPSGNLFTQIFPEIMAEVSDKSKKRIYQTDFQAWSADILGKRYYQKLQDVIEDIVNGDKPRTAVKSANGVGKSFLIGDIVTWFVTAFPPGDNLAIMSAPTLHQIENVLFRFLKTNYGYVQARAAKDKSIAPLPGFINEALEWKIATLGGNKNIAFGKRPSDKDIVSSFQGTRGDVRTGVFIDEAGGVPQDLFTAAEAVATGQDALVVDIGNPDRRGTEFHRVFTQPELMKEWNLHTISAYDLPTMTGEIVYPNEPEKQKAMLKGLTSREWIEHKERIWKVGDKWDARGMAKVLGEFPGETDNTFFPQAAIDQSHNADIDPAGAPVFMGVDVAGSGKDESVVYVNKGGNVRLFDNTIHYNDGGEDRTTTGIWSQEDEVTSARRIHAIAMYLGADEVRVDAAGLGGGIFKMLERLDEFDNKQYNLIRIIGSNSSSDKNRWANIRAENHDALRRLMLDGLIDIDPNDTVLRDELLAQTYTLNNRGAVQITPKKDMVTEFSGSPDRLDALIYATTDVGDVYGPQPGDVIRDDLSEYETPAWGNYDGW